MWDVASCCLKLAWNFFTSHSLIACTSLPAAFLGAAFPGLPSDPYEQHLWSTIVILLLCSRQIYKYRKILEKKICHFRYKLNFVCTLHLLLSLFGIVTINPLVFIIYRLVCNWKILSSAALFSRLMFFYTLVALLVIAAERWALS